MSSITLKGNPITISGNLPAVGSVAPAFSLVKTDLSLVTLGDLRGQRVILNIFPSVDTPTCATSVRKFNAEAAKLANTVVLCVSKDLPFAHKRFCGAEGLNHVHGVSDFRAPTFATDYGILITSGPIQGLLARAVVVVGIKGEVTYTELVAEIANEPDYAKALAILR